VSAVLEFTWRENNYKVDRVRHHQFVKEVFFFSSSEAISR